MLSTSGGQNLLHVLEVVGQSLVLEGDLQGLLPLLVLLKHELVHA